MKQWLSAAPPAADAAPQFHFITECFFLTAHALHLGIVKLLDKLNEIQPGMRMLERQARSGDALARARLHVRPYTPCILTGPHPSSSAVRCHVLRNFGGACVEEWLCCAHVDRGRRVVALLVNRCVVTEKRAPLKR